MANDAINTEPNINRTSIRVDLDVNSAIEQLMKNERRPSMANTMEWLLATHPLVKKIMAAEPATAAN